MARPENGGMVSGGSPFPTLTIPKTKPQCISTKPNEML